MIKDIENLLIEVLSEISTDIINDSTIYDIGPNIITKTENVGDIEIDNEKQETTQKVYLHMSELMKVIYETKRMAYIDLITKLCKKYALGLNMEQFQIVNKIINNLVKSLIYTFEILKSSCETRRYILTVVTKTGQSTINNNVYDQMPAVFRDCVRNAIKICEPLLFAVKELETFRKLSNENIQFDHIVYLWALYSCTFIAVRYRYIFLLIVIAGVCLIIYSFKKEIQFDKFVETISSRKPLCTINDSRVVNTTTDINTIRDICISDDKCDAFDFKYASGSSTIYTKPNCRTWSDKTKFVLKPKLSSAPSPPYNLKMEIKPGDLYIDQDTAKLYQVDDDGQWREQFNIIDEKEVSFTFVSMDAPVSPATRATFGNHWIHLLSDFSKWVVYRSDRPSKSWLKIHEMRGPGLYVYVPYGNVSGYKVDKTDMWSMFIGVSAMSIGFIGMLLP